MADLDARVSSRHENGRLKRELQATAENSKRAEEELVRLKQELRANAEAAAAAAMKADEVEAKRKREEQEAAEKRARELEDELARGQPATAALKAALPLEKAVEATEAASGLKVCLDTTKVEVCWQVADEEAEDSSPIILW